MSQNRAIARSAIGSAIARSAIKNHLIGDHPIT